MTILFWILIAAWGVIVLWGALSGLWIWEILREILKEKRRGGGV